MVERVQRKGNPLTLLVRMQMGVATIEKQNGGSFKKKLELTYDPAAPLPGIYPEKIQTLIHKECSQ